MRVEVRDLHDDLSGLRDGITAALELVAVRLSRAMLIGSGLVVASAAAVVLLQIRLTRVLCKRDENPKAN